MTITDYIKTIKRMDRLIHAQSTGTPEEFAKRLSISVRSIYNYISLMKELGAPIQYSRFYESYIYKMEGRFILEFEPSDLLYYVNG